MKAVGKLLMLQVRRLPVGCVAVALVYACSMAALIATGEVAVVIAVGLAAWLWYMLTGMTLRTLMRAETLLLPHFRRHLALAGAVYAIFTVAVPVIAMTVMGGGHYVPLATSLLLLAMAFGMATGLGMRVTLLFWLAFMVVGWMPAVSAAIGQVAMQSPLTPLAIVLIAGLLLYYALRPLLTVSDREVDDSPMQSIADGRKPATGADGAPKRRGLVGRKLSPLLDGIAQRTLAAALMRFDRRRTPSTRMAVIRAVLLPHDNPVAAGINLLVVAGFAALYFFATDAARRWQAGYVGAYAVMIGISRFGAVGHGMVRMRPNLADLYMTLAPRTRSEFQATLADALLWVVGVAMFNCVAYALLVAVLLHDAHPARLLLAAGITGIGGAFGALAAHLVGPESTLGRTLMHLAVAVGAVAVYALVYWLIGRFGLLAGGLGGALLTLPFGIGAWHAARSEYVQRAPRFDAPLT